MKKIVVRLILVLLIGGAAYALNRYGVLARTLDWVKGCGVWSPAVFLIVYVLSSIFFIPSSLLTFSSGILFGFWKGFLLSVIGTGLGALSAFWIGRYLARTWVEERVGRNPEFQRLSHAIREKGWKVILLARLSPVSPFLIGNYAFGVTRIRAAHYFLASVTGTIPSALLYVYLGFLTGDLSNFQNLGRHRTWEEWLLLALGLVATVVLIWYLRRIAEKDLNHSGCAGTDD